MGERTWIHHPRRRGAGQAAKSSGEFTAAETAEANERYLVHESPIFLGTCVLEEILELLENELVTLFAPFGHLFS